MKRLIPLAFALAACLSLSACGSVNQSAAVRETVQQYWYDIGHAKLAQAYHMMTTGNQASRSVGDYSQDMMSFLENTAGVSVKVGKPVVHGDFAVVDVWLSSPKSSGRFHAYQHLYRENGHWRISDQNGGLSQSR